MKIIEQPTPLSTFKTAQRTPEFIGIKFATEEKTSLKGPKNIKECKQVVVNFNGKKEKATMIVLSGKCIACLQAVTGCFYHGKPGPFANRAPSWIFKTRGSGDERASTKNEGGGRGREEKNRLLED